MSNLFEQQDGESQWLPISDLMSVLMMVFLLIAISYMIQVFYEKEKIQEVAVTYNVLRNELYEDLNEEFEADLPRWNAAINRNNLSVRFKSPEVLFSVGSASLKPEFKEILENFFPRFIQILYSEKYRDDIEEIRIEGHTSSYWRLNTSSEMAYIYNMELSQDRTRNVLQFVLQNNKYESLAPWIRSNVTANGLSSSKLIYNNDGTEDRESSRRVEFRVKTNAEERIARILSE